MSRVQKKLLVASVFLTGAIGYLAYAGVSAGRSYYVSVDDYLADTEYHSQQVRLHGTVADEEIEDRPEEPSMTFTLAGQVKTIRVRYTKSLPDMFQVGGEVLVVGKIDDKGVFQANRLETKCASKYEMKQAGPENAS